MLFPFRQTSWEEEEHLDFIKEPYKVWTLQTMRVLDIGTSTQGKHVRKQDSQGTLVQHNDQKLQNSIKNTLRKGEK